jgi:hypothetical protein
MKTLLSILFLLCAINLPAQKIIKTENVTDKSIHVFGDSFEGVIFTDKYEFRLGIAKSNGKNFTPTENDILLVEKLLRKNLDTVKSFDNQNKLIKRKLKHYWRQYFGYINEKGERIIAINGLWKNLDFTPNWLKNIVIVLDGGDDYWQIKINLDKLELFEFDVNGVA